MTDVVDVSGEEVQTVFGMLEKRRQGDMLMDTPTTRVNCELKSNSSHLSHQCMHALVRS